MAVTFHPVRHNSEHSPSRPDGAEDVWFTTSDGVSLHGWFFPVRSTPADGTIIFFHGNGGNISNVGWVGERFSGRGFNVLLFDYRGYGQSGGEVVDEQSLYRDADAAYDFILKTRHISAESVVLYGQSLGTTMVADLASRRQCGALIIESGLSSASNVASEVLPWLPRPLHILMKNRFDVARKLAGVRRPILIIHGEEDSVVSTRHAHALFAAANEPKQLIIFPGEGHNVFGSVGDKYFDTLLQFIEGAISSRGKQRL